MILLNFLILFLFTYSFCNAQNEHNFTVQEIDRIARETNIFKSTETPSKSFFGKKVHGASLIVYYTYKPKENNEKELVKGVYIADFIYRKYSEHLNVELFFKKGKLFFVRLQITKYKKNKGIENHFYKCYVIDKKLNCNNLPDRIKKLIKNRSKEMLKNYNYF